MVLTPLRRLRAIGLLEGLSYLVLLGIAMPLKYLGGMPQAVQITGAIHGGLFILFVLSVFEVTVRRPWWSPKFWLAAAAAAVIPAGTFVFDRWLRQVELREAAPNVTASGVPCDSSSA
jgi:integral membrane protein